MTLCFDLLCHVTSEYWGKILCHTLTDWIGMGNYLHLFKVWVMNSLEHIQVKAIMVNAIRQCLH